ncbi:MAG: hypothetical protein COU65_02740 [Candidatus Pacebacteria bacterium CG10_big_fil_rev_8_21_14_0_10_42_12]|nr:MAG: hypothetical protein COU65_02740 [Candidatus Pacebacteria bacterium CG10_big_fil_rev_8_21_14_0_10_42_12]
MISAINAISDWLQLNYDLIISLTIQVFIAYHVFFLSKRLSSRERLKQKEAIQKKVNKLFSKISALEGSREVYLVNIGRYFNDYPANNLKVGGYSHIKAEIKSCRFDGIEFFAEMPRAVYKKTDGHLSFKGTKSERCFDVYPVGLVPYEWIEDIDLTGDEFAYAPLFYCHFKGKIYWKLWRRWLPYGYPYQSISYYKLDDSFQEKNQPFDMKYQSLKDTISES